MSFTGIVRFGKVLCQFDHFGPGLFWDTWKWQTDPYRVNASFTGTQSSIPLMIENAKTDVSASGVLLAEEHSGFYKRQVFRTADGGTLWAFVRSSNGEIVLQYAVSPAWDKIVLLADHSQSAGHLAFEYLAQIMPGVCLKYDMLTFHGVLLEDRGRGIVISAPSGTGKTTHARMWRDSRNSLIINGDRAACYRKDGEWIGCGLPWSGTSGEQINRSVPLKALVVLERGAENRACRVTGLEAFGLLLPHLQYPSWDLDLAEKAMDLTDDFLSHVPVVRLQCRPDLNAVEILAQTLEKL